MFMAQSSPTPVKGAPVMGAPTMQSYPVITGSDPTMSLGAPTAGQVMMGEGQMNPEMIKRLMMARQNASPMGLQHGAAFGRNMAGPRPMQPPMLPSNGVLGLMRGKQTASQLLPSSTMGQSGPVIGGYQSPTTRLR